MIRLVKLGPIHGIFVLFVVASMLVLPGNRLVYDSIKIAVFSTGIALIALYAFYEATQSKFKLKANWIDLIVFLRVMYLLLQIVLSAKTISFNIRWVSELGIFTFYVVLRFVFSQQRASIDKHNLQNNLVDALIVMCLLQSLIAFLQIVRIIPYDGNVVYDSVVTGTFGNPNYLASFLLLSLPLVIWRSNELPLLPNTLKVICILFLISIIILTKSRASYIALVAILLTLYHKKILEVWFSLKSGVKVLGVVFLISGTVLMGLLLFNMDNESSLGRLFIWNITTDMFSDAPMVGIGNYAFETNYLSYQKEYFLENMNAEIHFAANIRQAHNHFLETLAEQGIIGILIFAALILTILIRLLSYLRSNAQNTLIFPLFASFVGFLVFGLFDSPFFYFFTKLLFFLMVALVASNFGRTIGYKQSNLKLTLSSALLVSSISLLVLLAPTIPGYYHWNKGIKFKSEYKWNKALESYQKANNYLRFNGKFHFDYAYANLMSGYFNEAIREFEEATKTFSDKNIYLFKAMAYEKNLELAQAEAIYLNLIETFPNLLKPKLKLSEIYINQQLSTEAEILLNEIVNANPKVKNSNTLHVQKQASQILQNLRLKD
jgi:O-antigen polymerase